MQEELYSTRCQDSEDPGSQLMQGKMAADMLRSIDPTHAGKSVTQASWKVRTPTPVGWGI